MGYGGLTVNNGVQNSHDETYLVLFSRMLDDIYQTIQEVSQKYPFFPDCSQRDLLRMKERDYEYVVKRTRKEGLQFLTISLPKLGKWVDQGLQSGGNWPIAPKGFHPYSEGGQYPRLFGPIWRGMIFAIIHATNTDNLDDLFTRLIRQLRTLLFCFYKLETPFTDEQKSVAVKSYISNDAGCGIIWSGYTSSIIEGATRVVKWAMKGVNLTDITPKHGPGAVSTGERYEGKWVFSHYYHKLHRVYPYYEYMYGVRENGHANHLLALVKRYRSMDRNKIPTNKLVLVPKDSRGPRTICAEPLEFQFIQQGLARNIVHFLETISPCKGQINFTSQEVNRALALSSSADCKFATLDLKDASDLVSLELVRLLFPKGIFARLDATRSDCTLLPNGEVIALKKFAPMGSALCFPIESMVFYAVCCAALLSKGVPFNVAVRSVFVYGDDIIVTNEHWPDVVMALEEVGLAVNIEKCCVGPIFRESCGMDALCGVPVTPVRVKKVPCRRPSEGTQAMAWLEYSKHFHGAHMPQASAFCREVVIGVYGFVPYVSRPEPYLSVCIPELETPLKEYPKLRWCKGLQLHQAKLFCVSPKKRKTTLDGHDRLLRSLVDPVHGLPDEVVERDTTQTRMRWCNIYVEPDSLAEGLSA